MASVIELLKRVAVFKLENTHGFLRSAGELMQNSMVVVQVSFIS